MGSGFSGIGTVSIEHLNLDTDRPLDEVDHTLAVTEVWSSDGDGIELSGFDFDLYLTRENALALAALLIAGSRLAINAGVNGFDLTQEVAAPARRTT